MCNIFTNVQLWFMLIYIYLYIYIYIHIYIHTHPRAGTYSIFNGVLSHFLRFLRLSKRETWGTLFGTSPHWYNFGGYYILLFCFNGHFRYRCIGGTWHLFADYLLGLSFRGYARKIWLYILLR